jgi:hypothetical protein
MTNKSLESLILRVDKVKFEEIKLYNTKFDYAIDQDNKYWSGGEIEDDTSLDNIEKDLYIFDIVYCTPLLYREINEASIKDFFKDYILNNWNVAGIFKKYIQEIKHDTWKEKLLHLIIEIYYDNHQGYYDEYPDVEVFFDIFGKLDNDYLIDDLEEFKLK